MKPSPPMEPPRPVSLEAKRELGARVRSAGYYTNGRDLIAVTRVGGSTGCVEFSDCRSGFESCLGIVDFRAEFWLARA